MKEKLTNAAERVLQAAYAKADASKSRFEGMFFVDLWENTVKEAGSSKKTKEEGAADFYSELLQDPRFVNVGSNKWRLRAFIDFAEFKRIKGAMYGIDNLDRVEEEHRTKEINPSKTDVIATAPELDPAESEMLEENLLNPGDKDEEE